MEIDGKTVKVVSDRIIDKERHTEVEIGYEDRQR